MGTRHRIISPWETEHQRLSSQPREAAQSRVETDPVAHPMPAKLLLRVTGDSCTRGILCPTDLHREAFVMQPFSGTVLLAKVLP